MGARGIVFVGPSLAPQARPQHAELAYRAPAVQGDLIRAAREGVEAIGLVDGQFHQSLAVTPAEVREVAGRGVHLVGGGSMGALRACDCPGHITGVGDVYRMFSRGILIAEDEVAGTYVLGSDVPVAFPLVVIRELLDRAVVRNALDPAAKERALERIRSVPYHERTRSLLRDALEDHPSSISPILQELVDFANVKHRDALAVIAEVARWLAEKTA